MIIARMETDNCIENDQRLHFIDQSEGWYIGEIINEISCELPSSVEIETINKCNNDCSFCPVNRNADIRPALRMEETLFKKIIKDLKEIGYEGYLSLFSNNEPLLDVRIYEWIEYAKKELPHAKHALYTNGTLLDKEKYMRLAHSLDYLVIDNYDNDMTLLNNITELCESVECSKTDCKCYVWIRKKDQVLQNRGGLSPNKKTFDTYESACALPFFQMVIRPDGKVSRCCQDVYGQETLGDVSKTPLIEVWNSPEYCSLRESMRLHGRSGVPACSRCDQFGLNNYFPKQWNGKYFLELLKWTKDRLKEGKRVYINDNEAAGAMAELFRAHDIYINGICDLSKRSMTSEEACILLSYDYDILENLKKNNLKVIDNYIVFDCRKYLDPIRLNYQIDFRSTLKRVLEADKSGKLIAFGAGNRAKQIIEGYKLNPCMIVDNSKDKIGSVLFGKTIETAQILDEKTTADCLVVNMTSEFFSISKQLVRQGVSVDRIVNGLDLL